MAGECPSKLTRTWRGLVNSWGGFAGIAGMAGNAADLTPSESVAATTFQIEDFNCTSNSPFLYGILRPLYLHVLVLSQSSISNIGSKMDQG